MTGGAIHAGLEPALKRFVAEMEGLFQRDLLSVCVFGAAAQGDFQPDLTEVNVLIVLRQVGAPELRKLVAPIQAARKDFFLDPLLFTIDDLRNSTDVFPLRLIQMRRGYQILSGQDFISTLFVNPEHIRLACEREAKTTVLRLRQLYLVRAGLRPAWQAALVDNIQQTVGLIGYALELTGHGAPGRTEKILDMAEREIGIDQAVMLRVLLLRLSGERLEHAQLETLYEQYLDCVEKVARYVDRLSRD